MLRHALAGTKLADPELDFVRGLDAVGRAGANGVPDLIFEYVRPWLLVSSPFARCVETMNPLAEATLLPVFARDELTPAAPPGIKRPLKPENSPSGRMRGVSAARLSCAASTVLLGLQMHP